MRSQGASLVTPTPLFVLFALSTAAALASVGALVERAAAAVGLWGATGALFMLGLIGLFSIGIFLLLASGLSLAAAVGARRRTRASLGLCVLAAIAGIAVALGSFVPIAAVD